MEKFILTGYFLSTWFLVKFKKLSTQIDSKIEQNQPVQKQICLAFHSCRLLNILHVNEIRIS